MIRFNLKKQAFHQLSIIIFVSIFLCSLSNTSLGESPDNDGVHVVSADMSNDHTLALLSNGTVWAWGVNNVGQCGVDITGDTIEILSPGQVSGISDVKEIAAGQFFSLALKNDGTVWAWGTNEYGELGIGIPPTLSQADSHPHPVQVPGLNDVIAIDAGNEYAMALTGDGIVYTWGYNGEGALGNRQPVNDNSYVTSPVEVDGPTDVKAIHAGPVNAMVLTKNGTLWAWGHVSYILGERSLNATSSRNSTPDILLNIPGIKSVALGDNHAVILKSDGTVWTWGNDWRGKLGNSSSRYHDPSPDFTITPIEVPGLANVTAIAAGIEHTVVLKDDGTVWTWGGNEYGQIGDGTRDDKNKPVQVSVSNVRAISAGGQNTAVIDASDILKICGVDVNGQLGDGLSGNGLYKSRLQPVSFGFTIGGTDTSQPSILPGNDTNVQFADPLVDNMMRIAALLVIIVIVGAGALFYLKKK